MSARIEFQRKHAIGKIVNIGAGEDCVGFPSETVHVDLDKWKHEYSIQADAHNLPLRDNSFHSAILGDILEHAVDPLKMILEAKRVAERVVLTIFEEWRLGGAGQHVDVAFRLAEQELKKQGYESLNHYCRSYEGFKGKFIQKISEQKLPHSFHINQFTDEDVNKLIEKSGMKCLIFEKKPEATHEGHTWKNWLILLEKT